MGVFAGSPARGGSGGSGGSVSSFMQTIDALSSAGAVRAALGLAIGSDVQAQDAELAAFAALVSAANKLGYFSGSGAMSLTDFTAFARTILDDPDAATVLATIGAEPSDAELLAIAGLTSAANKLAYFTGSGTASLTDLSAFVRTLLDDADAATALATLGAQPLDTELTAFAGLSSAANKLGYFSGTGAMALADLTAFARTLLDDSDAATARATLGLSGLVSYSILASDFTDSTGAAVDTGLTFTPAASSKYLIEVFLAFKSAATTTGMQWSFHGPTSGATRQAAIQRVPNTSTSEIVRAGAFDVMVPGNSVTSTGVDYLATGQAVLITGPSPSGAVTIQAQTEVAASQITIYTGSFMKITLLP